MKHLLIVLFSLLQLSCTAQANQNPIYVCLPCHRDCDRLQFEQSGSCPACGMRLIEKNELIETEEFFFVFNDT